MNADDDKAIEEARRAGLDLNLIDLNLELSPEQRVLKHDAALELMLECRKAGAALYGHATPTYSAAR
jgi:hypothetical protein